MRRLVTAAMADVDAMGVFDVPAIEATPRRTAAALG
jgi:hypothetical protein